MSCCGITSRIVFTIQLLLPVYGIGLVDADIKTSSLRGVVRMKSNKKEAVFYVWAHTHKTTS